MPINSPNTSNQYFEIPILFSIVERSSNNFNGNQPTKDVVFPLFTYSISYWKRVVCLTFGFQKGKGNSGDPFKVSVGNIEINKNTPASIVTTTKAEDIEVKI